MRRFPAGKLTFFQQHNIFPPQLCQMICNVCPVNSPTNNHNFCLIFHCYTLFMKYSVVECSEQQRGTYRGHDASRYFSFASNSLVSVRPSTPALADGARESIQGHSTNRGL